MTTTVSKFEQWCILEIMGHQRFAGFVSEQSLGGASFVRIDVPEFTDSNTGQTRPAFTKLFGSSSIYAITPTTEQLARAYAQQLAQAPVNVYDLPADYRPRISTSRAVASALAGPPSDLAPDEYDFSDDDEPDQNTDDYISE